MGERRLDIEALKKKIAEWGKPMQYCTNTTCNKAFFCKRSIVHVLSKSCFLNPAKTGECGFFIPRTARKQKAGND